MNTASSQTTQINPPNQCCSDSETIIQIPQKEFVKLLEASVHIQNITNQVNLLIINAAAEAVYTGQDDFAIAVNEVRKLVNESGNQSKIISETLEALSLC